MLQTAQIKPPAEVLTDAFGWPGDLKKVFLRLTYQGYHLLTEEYPATRPDIRPSPADETFPYAYTGEVRSWVGIGRFVLGLPGQAIIDGPDEFRAYVRGRVGEVLL